MKTSFKIGFLAWIALFMAVLVLPFGGIWDLYLNLALMASSFLAGLFLAVGFNE